MIQNTRKTKIINKNESNIKKKNSNENKKNHKKIINVKQKIKTGGGAEKNYNEGLRKKSLNLNKQLKKKYHPMAGYIASMYSKPLYDLYENLQMAKTTDDTTKMIIEIVHFSPIFQKGMTELVDDLIMKQNINDEMYRLAMVQILKLYFQQVIETAFYGSKTSYEYKTNIYENIERIYDLFGNEVTASFFNKPILLIIANNNQIQLYQDNLDLFSHYVTILLYACYYQDFENDFTHIKYAEFLKTGTTNAAVLANRIQNYQSRDINDKLSTIFNSLYIMRLCSKKIFDLISELIYIGNYIVSKKKRPFSANSTWTNMIQRYHLNIQEAFQNLIRNPTLKSVVLIKTVNYQSFYTNVFNNDFIYSLIQLIEDTLFTFYSVQLYGEYNVTKRDEIKGILQSYIQNQMQISASRLKNRVLPPAYNNSFINMRVSPPAYMNNRLSAYNRPPAYNNNRPPAYNNNRPPAYNNNRPPAYNNSPPAYTNSPPAYNNNRPPAYNNSPPAYNNSPPAYNNSPPAYINNRPPAYTNNRPPNYGNIYAPPALPARRNR